jgi:histidine ammonia-lyase
VTVVLNDRNDFTLDAVRRVALDGEGVRLSATALRRMQRAHDQFQRFVDANRGIFIYGVTSLGGSEAARHRTPEETLRIRRTNKRPHLSFSSESMPEAAMRATVLATLVQFIEGNTATHPQRAQRMAALLDRPLPRVPAQGVTVPGEILAMAHLYRDVPQLVRGSGHQAGSGNGMQFTCGMSAVAAIQSRRRLELVARVFALSVEAFNAPLAAYDPAFKGFWGDRYESQAIDALNGHLRGARTKGRRSFQAPVSYRVLPRLLGQAYRAVAALEEVSAISMRAIASNPAYSLPDRRHPLGHTFSNAGYHNAICPPALDNVAASWVDMAQLAHRHISKLHKGETSRLPDRLYAPDADPATRASTGGLDFVPNGFIEEMRLLAQPTLLSSAEPAAGEQDDMNAPGFMAYVKHVRVSELLDSTIAILAASASQALHVTKRPAPTALRPFLRSIRETFPPVETGRDIGDDAQRLAERFTAAASSGDVALRRSAS